MWFSSLYKEAHVSKTRAKREKHASLSGLRLHSSGTTLPFYIGFMNDSFKDMIAEGWLIVYMDDMLITATNEKENTE